MFVLNYKGCVIKYTLSTNNIHIVDSYKIKKKTDMNAIIKLIRAEATKRGFKYKRSNSSWVTEWRAHNYMYERGIEKARTGSVDLNEDESKLRLVGYSTMSLLYKG